VLLDQMLWIFEGTRTTCRLMGQFGHPKSIEGRVYYILDRGRRAKIIPFEWVRDDNIVTYSSPWYEGPEGFWDYVGAQIKRYRGDRQAGQRQRMEMWCEAAGMGPQLDRGLPGLLAAQRAAERSPAIRTRAAARRCAV
jgi:hypothetical protein